MCALCGVVGAPEHWTEAHARPGAFTPNTDPTARRRDRARRLVSANRVLCHFGLKLSDWRANAFVLSTRTGKSAIVHGFSKLFPAAEALVGKSLDPLDPALLSKLEATA